jgi:hypothetical protein
VKVLGDHLGVGGLEFWRVLFVLSEEGGPVGLSEGFVEVVAEVFVLLAVDVGVALSVSALHFHEVGQLLAEDPAVHVSVKLNNYNSLNKTIINILTNTPANNYKNV